ncbi:MAG TPA: hypothetical protein VLS89_07325 [Candidatus Nanopelagicales bacterium]|nr:hypothetical protein [Candidatus Nanopelagicales bacterium]
MAPIARPAALAATWFALAVVGGCSDDTTSSSTGGVAAEPSLAISSPAEGACVAVGTDPNATFSVQVGAGNVRLRPPGACGNFANCGYLVLRVNGVENNRASTRLIDVQLRKLADPYADLTISVEVHTSEGQPLLNRAGEPVMASVQVRTEPSCGAGAGGAGGAGGMGGSGGAGGAGGAMP